MSANSLNMSGPTDLESRIQACYSDKVSLNSIFDQDTSCMLQDVSGINSFASGYIIPHFLAATCHLMNKSVVNAWGEFSQPACVYTMNVGYTSTNKSGSLSAVSSALLDVEDAIGIPINSSLLNNGEFLTIRDGPLVIVEEGIEQN